VQYFVNPKNKNYGKDFGNIYSMIGSSNSSVSLLEIVNYTATTSINYTLEDVGTSNTTNATTEEDHSLLGKDNIVACVNFFVCLLLLFGMYYFASKPATRTTSATTDSESRRRRLHRIARQRHLQVEQDETMVALFRTDPDYRNRIIEDALIVKQVMALPNINSDAMTNYPFVLGDVRNDENNDQMNKGDYNEIVHSIEQKANEKHENSFVNNDESCCSICLEPYQVGDIVAWSRYSDIGADADNNSDKHQQSEHGNCLHVFHKDCIIPWFQYSTNHNDCPACRTVLLRPKKDADSNEDGEEDHDNDIEAVNGNNTTASGVFVIVHGLISKIVQYGRTNTSCGGRIVTSDYERILNPMEDGDDDIKAPPSIINTWSIRRTLSFGSSTRRKQQQQFPNFSHTKMDVYEPLLTTKADDVHEQNHSQASLTLEDSIPLANKFVLIHSPSTLRRVVSAGPGTPTTATKMHRKIASRYPLRQDTDNSMIMPSSSSSSSSFVDNINTIALEDYNEYTAMNGLQQTSRKQSLTRDDSVEDDEEDTILTLIHQ
jgi:Anaphase-promoting complex subunit 11 RING-H2 finger